jgi:Na+/proline symporter
MKAVYLALAIAGALIPYLFFAQHIAAQGTSLPDFVAALFANPAAGGCGSSSR